MSGWFYFAPVIRTGWQVHFLPAELPAPAGAPSWARIDGWADWLRRDGTPPGTPFVLSPRYEYDVELNGFFRSAGMLAAASNTQAGYARDLAAFLTFLTSARHGRPWRDATEADHTAYLVWRRRDERGPQVADATWDREVAAVNRFYCWQVRAGNVAANPIPQRTRRNGPYGGRWSGGEVPGELPATYSHGAAREQVQWLPAASYRRWRDVGVRGYTAAGLPNPAFRGRWAARNATFCDLMVRTGLRLSEQAGLCMFEVPLDRGAAGYQRFWLPPALAKGGSARWVYVPASVVSELITYVEIDRAVVVAEARDRGEYARIRRPLVIEDPGRPEVARGGGGRVKVSRLDQEQRFRLLVDGPDGMSPAALWLSEQGLPVAVSTWKNLFREANRRCTAHGLGLRAYPHLLRHTFAVITLEQLQRGHIAELGELSEKQRGHYTRVFGDPLDWVRRRLGHRSVLTTQIYLHALAELEMATRMALVPDGWEDPRETVTPADDVPDGDTASVPAATGRSR